MPDQFPEMQGILKFTLATENLVPEGECTPQSCHVPPMKTQSNVHKLTTPHQNNRSDTQHML